MVKYRDRECENGHKWSSPVFLADAARALSGERTEYCPECGKPEKFSSPTYNVNGFMHMPIAKVKVGRIVYTPGVEEFVMADAAHREERSKELAELLVRHTTGDWGMLDKQDVADNERRLKNNVDVMSVYEWGGKHLYIKTEQPLDPNASLTTILWSDEY